MGKFGPENKQIGEVVAVFGGVGGQDWSRKLAHWGGTGWVWHSWCLEWVWSLA